jgi:hypothetical protein
MSPAFRLGTLRGLRCRPSAFLLVCLALASCKPAAKPDTDQADQMAMWLDSVPQLKTLNVSNAEIAELNITHQAGLTDPSTVVLIQLARERKQTFDQGQSVADLLNAGFTEDTVISLARMNLLGPWAGEARAMRLTGISDKIILAVAQRHMKNLPVLSGEKLGELKNTGVSDAVILEMVQRGDTDARANQFIAEREREAGGHKFVYQTHAHR